MEARPASVSTTSVKATGIRLNCPRCRCSWAFEQDGVISCLHCTEKANALADLDIVEVLDHDGERLLVRITNNSDKTVEL